MPFCRYCGTSISQDFVILNSNGVRSTEALGGKPSPRIDATFRQQSKIREFVNSKKTEETISACKECRELIAREIERQTREEEWERDSYLNFLQEIDSETLDEDISSLRDELEARLKEEQNFHAKLKDLSNRKRDAEKKLRSIELEHKEFGREENNFFKDFVEYEHKLHSFQEQHRISLEKESYATEELKKLEKRNVYQDTFFISTSEPIGTINGFRFGRLAEELVPWEEINAAWGEVTLLIYIIGRKLTDFEFKKFRPRPVGSRSFIDQINEGKHLQTLSNCLRQHNRITRLVRTSFAFQLTIRFGSDALGFDSWFWTFGKKQKNTFDAGMVAFLQCLGQVCNHVAHRAPSIEIPYLIHNDKIGGYSIRMQSSSEELWTKALKFLLVDLNYILAWVSSNAANLNH